MSNVKEDTIKNHLLEPGGSMSIKGKVYPANSIFKDVTLEITNDKIHPIMIKLSDTGLFIELVRGS